MGQSKAVLDAGGSWADVWLTMVRSDFHKTSIMDPVSGSLMLVQGSALRETGWSINAGDNQLFGEAGDDVLVGGAGSNLLDGGADTDVAVLFGAWSDFQVAIQGTDLLLKNTATGSLNTLRNIEILLVGTQAVATDAIIGLPVDGSYTDLKPVAEQIISTVGLVNIDSVSWNSGL